MSVRSIFVISLLIVAVGCKNQKALENQYITKGVNTVLEHIRTAEGSGIFSKNLCIIPTSKLYSNKISTYNIDEKYIGNGYKLEHSNTDKYVDNTLNDYFVNQISTDSSFSDTIQLKDQCRKSDCLCFAISHLYSFKNEYYFEVFFPPHIFYKIKVDEDFKVSILDTNINY